MEIENKDDLYCYYSDLPSPMAYAQTCADYDSMGNHGRFPRRKEERKNMKRIIQKFLLWLHFQKKPKKKKSIWEL